ncbi:MAG: hypothetical protein JSV60_08475 [Desulfobacterales bacterium]|nr:MAG: hypothetical protein JSV60_08475 [Desulfobacterales bacterium]
MAIDSKKIIELASGLPMASSEKGIIAAFGVYVAMNYNEFFFKLVSRIINMVDNSVAQVIEQKLYDAVLECAYHTFHGARSSMDWRDLILPMIKTPEDEIHALVAFTNIFGIGYSKVEELIPGERLVTTVKNAYDPGRYLEEYGPQPRGRCYMFKACTASYMDLVYADQYPDGMGTFISTEVMCRSTGHPTCRFVAELKQSR